jgi:hypothetical protein
MSTKRIPRVLAIATGDTLDLVQEALGDMVAIVHCVDIGKLRRHYGPAVAGEILRQLVSVRLQAQERGARRSTR